VKRILQIASVVLAVPLGVVMLLAPVWSYSVSQVLLPPAHHMLYGMNTRFYTGQAGITSLRYYARGIPTTFPGQPGQTVPDGITPIVSLNCDLAALADGSLDTQMKGYLKLAVPETLITVRHEANNAGNNVDPATYRAAIRRLAMLAKGFPVRVGQIFGTANRSQDLTPWIVPGLSWYALDGYQRVTTDTPASVFGHDYQQLLSLTKYASLGIAETNSNVNPDAWARVVYPWIVTQPRARMFAWFGCNDTRPCTLPLPSATIIGQDAREASAP
jgi:hypothetical protein